jgi:protein AATF/BFR2
LDPEQFDSTFRDQAGEVDDGAFSEDDTNARDHYITVGKSALRKSQFLMEDPKYSGKRSSRNAIFTEEDNQEVSDDEEEVEEEIDDDEEIESEADDVESQQSSDEDEQINGEESEEGDSDEFGSEDDEIAPPMENDVEVQEELKRMREEEKNMLSTLSKTAKADVEKGQHVKEQLNLWDGFLDTRIRMQKAMNITNQLPQVISKFVISMPFLSIPY